MPIFISNVSGKPLAFSWFRHTDKDQLFLSVMRLIMPTLERSEMTVRCSI